MSRILPHLVRGFIVLATLLAPLLAPLAEAAAHAATPMPVVVELFTSQACSDCPPADRLLAREQATQPGLIALDLHVTYWNSPAWRDRFALPAANALQQFYVDRGLTHEAYTPEAVVDGTVAMVGSDRPRLDAAIAAARASTQAAPRIPITITRHGTTAQVQIGAGPAPANTRIVAFIIDPRARTKVTGGENQGATLTEINVVRRITPLGLWHGAAITDRLTISPGQGLVVILQQPNGTIVGAAKQA